MKNRIEGLDVLRGIAVGLVLLRHAWPDTFGGAGIVGVVMFFTLSGYLITGVLMRDLERGGRVRSARFYRNRALRLIPALVAVTIAIAVVSAVWDPLGDRGHILRTAFVSLTYTSDLPFDHGSPAIGHLWTLAVEEQFYLIWPLVLVLGLRLRRLGGTVAVVAVLIELVAILGAISVAPKWPDLYTTPLPWGLAIVVGAALQLALHRYRMPWPQGRVRIALVVTAALVLALLAVTHELKNTMWVYVAGAPLIGCATAVLIVELRARRTVSAPIMRALLALGTVSYAVYLWDYPIVTWLDATVGAPLAGPLSIPAAITAATLSRFVIERPALRFKEALDRRADPQLQAERMGEVA